MSDTEDINRDPVYIRVMMDRLGKAWQDVPSMSLPNLIGRVKVFYDTTDEQFLGKLEQSARELRLAWESHQERLDRQDRETYERLKKKFEPRDTTSHPYPKIVPPRGDGKSPPPPAKND